MFVTTTQVSTPHDPSGVAYWFAVLSSKYCSRASFPPIANSQFADTMKKARDTLYFGLDALNKASDNDLKASDNDLKTSDDNMKASDDDLKASDA